jgi:predicted aspartyl protease/thioredoxin-like negative regulator of GroEL
MKTQLKRRSRFWPLTAGVVFICLSAVVTFGAENEKARNRAERALRSGDFEQAEKIYREVLAKDDHDNEARLGLSRALLKQRRLQDSFDHAARVIAVDPLSSRAHALLGSAILASGDFRLSVEEFRTALSLNENEALAVAGLAMIDYYENRMLPCVVGLRKAASIDPNEPDYLFNLGQAAARSERYKEAADAYERFLVIAPRTDADRRARIRGLIDFLRYLGQQGSLYNLEAGSRTVVSFETPDYRPIVKVRINGQKQYLRFVLDTGSGMSVLSEETAERLGIKPVARGGMARAVGGGGRFEIVYGYLRSIEIGEVRVTNVPVYIRHFFDEKNPVDGYLGIAAISRLMAAVDYGTNNLTLSRDPAETAASAVDAKPVSTEVPQTRPGINIPIRTTASGFLSGEVIIDGLDKPLNFIIDTGATVSVLSEKTAALEEVQRFIKKGTMRVFGAAGVAEDVKVASIPRLAIGSYSREKLDAAVLDLDPVNETAGFLQSGILGGNFLRHYRVIFYFEQGIVRFESLEVEPSPKTNSSPDTSTRQ